MATLTESRHAGEFIISEANGHRSRDTVTVALGSKLQAGHVVGQILTGSASEAADAGNTGNGTMSAITVGAGAQSGNYTLSITEAATDGGQFQVVDPEGDVVGVGSVGTEFTGGGLTFTLADGATDFAVGDTFTITVAEGSKQFKEFNPTNTDGSEVPAAVLFDAVDATAEAKTGVNMARDCEVTTADLTFFDGATEAEIDAAAAALAENGIILR